MGTVWVSLRITSTQVKLPGAAGMALPGPGNSDREPLVFRATLGVLILVRLSALELAQSALCHQTALVTGDSQSSQIVLKSETKL